MFDTKDEILRKIRLGEDADLELKEVRVQGQKVTAPGRSDLADELAAFANSRGGVCLLGVDDSSKDIVGIPLASLDAVEKLVSEICHDSIEPPIGPFIEKLELPDSAGLPRAVVKIEVDRSIFVHRSPGGYLHRVGSSKRQLRPDVLARLFQERSQTRFIRFDEEVVADASLEELSRDALPLFVTERTGEEWTNVLRKLGLANVDSGGIWRPTVSGVLMGSNDPRSWLPNAFVQAVAYRGDSVVPAGPHDVYQLDAKDIVGPLQRQIAESCLFIYTHMRIAARKEMGRQDLPQYDMAAVLEAVVNAIVHRDYSIYGSKVRLRMFSDRLELYSPGGLPNSLGLEALSDRQSVRNETLASMLARCPVPDYEWLHTPRKTLMDRRGEGVPTIMRNSELLSGRLPEYRLLGESELMLTIWAANPLEQEAQEPVEGERP